MKVMIIGAPRSGTSLVAGLLYQCGLYMGSKFRIANPANPKGCFENLKFGSINRSFFKENKGRELDNFIYSTELLNQVKLFLSKWPKDKLCGWKHVRATITYPAWKSVMAKEELKIIFVLRPTSEIVESIKVRGWDRNLDDREKREHIRKFIMTGIDNLIYADGHIFTYYHNYFKDWGEELGKVTDFLGLKIPNDTKEIENFIDEDLWHHRSRK